jgi:uncharacterized membrane protein HdeD (DUF308 family)
MSDSYNHVESSGSNMTLLGIATVGLGVLVLLAPLVVGMSIIYLLGVLVFIAGAIRLYWAFQAVGLENRGMMYLVAALTLLCGIVMLASPTFTAGLITVVLVVYLLLDGLVEIAAALRIRPQQGWAWLLFGGMISILLGILLWQQFPLSGAWAIGVLLGIKLLIIGITMITVGASIRTALLPPRA